MKCLARNSQVRDVIAKQKEKNLRTFKEDRAGCHFICIQAHCRPSYRIYKCFQKKSNRDIKCSASGIRRDCFQIAA